MNPSQPRIAHALWAIIVLAAATGAAPALAAGASNAAKSEARYQRDAAVCLSSRYTGDKADCLSEASTARASREPVMIVVPVLITNCQVSLKPNSGPVTIQTAITATASTKTRGRPQKWAAALAKCE